MKTLRTTIKQANPYYFTPEWKALRLACLQRDRFRCVLCGARAIVADHIHSRKGGGRDELVNLRSLCRMCDNRIKESAAGRRARDGNAGVVGPDGWPLTPRRG